MKKGWLSGNQLKILALITMTCDHIGKYLLPDFTWLQIFGRLAYPIFAYMIAEGATYTKDRKRYVGLLALSAAVCQVVYLFVMHSLYQCIMVTFTLSVLLICVLDYAKERPGIQGFGAVLLSVCGAYFLTEVMPNVVHGFYVDYSFWGVMLPVFVYCAYGKVRKIGILTIVLALLAMDSNSMQWFSLAAIPLLTLYDGTRGTYRLKYLFYIYYPLLLVVIYLLEKMI